MPPKQMSLQHLSLEQLDGLKKQFETDTQALTQAHDGLRGAKSRFEGSKTQLENFKGLKEGDEILVPITSSLYVTGNIKTTNRVTVDVGTGYYIEQSVPRAQQFFDKRADQMSKQIDKVQGAIDEKQTNLNMVMQIMQQKMQMQRQMQEQQ